MDPETMFDCVANVSVKDGRIAIITKKKTKGRFKRIDVEKWKQIYSATNLFSEVYISFTKPTLRLNYKWRLCIRNLNRS
jgi:hypothetical protein